MLLAATLLPTALAAQDLAAYDYEDLEFRGIGFEAGRLWPARIDATNYFGLRVDLGWIGPSVRVATLARYWASSLLDAEVRRLASQIVLVCERQADAACPEELDLGEVRFSDLELGAEAHYVVMPTRRISPYVGGGVSLHLLNGRGDFIDDTFVEDLLDTISPGASATAGLAARIGSSLQVGVEARFMLASDIRYGSAALHGLWTLPTPRAPGAVAVR